MSREIRRRMACAAATVLLVIVTGTAAGQAAQAHVVQPRPFGYVVGDLVRQRVLLKSGASDFEPAALPRAERSGVWLERRPARIRRDPDGRRWMIVEYQIINAPQELTTVTLPALEIASASGQAPLRIAAWPITVAPLTPRLVPAQGGLQEIRPDRAPPTVPTEPIARRVAFFAGSCALTLSAWLAWLLWRNRRAASRQPFARAQREIRGLDATAPAAWQALHRAFDRTAGRVVQSATLPVLFERAPHFEPLRPKIERFFAQSRELFFGGGLPDEPVSVHELCGELRRAERRHER